MKAHGKDILRFILKGKKRFFSLMLIAALGVTTMTGLRASCRDLRYSADQFFDERQLFDISVVSTMGLTDEDVDALLKLEGVEKAEGGYTIDANMVSDEENKRVEIFEFNENGMNIPLVLEGRLPEKQGEIAVSQKYALIENKHIGDVIFVADKEEKEVDEEELFSETQSPSLSTRSFKITAVVLDARNINRAQGVSSQRSISTYDYSLFVPTGTIKSDVFTIVYLRVTDAAELLCYSKEYTKKVNFVIDQIESKIKIDRETARYNAIMAEAREKISDAEDEMYSEFFDAEEKLANARNEINEGKELLLSGKQQLSDEKKSVAAQFQQALGIINTGFEDLQKGEKELESAKSEIEEGKAQLAKAKADLKASSRQAQTALASAKNAASSSLSEIKSSQAECTEKKQQIESKLSEIWDEEAWQEYVLSVKTAYQPVSNIALRISDLEARLAAETQGTEGYNQLNAALNQAMNEYEGAEQNANANFAEEAESMKNALSENGVADDDISTIIELGVAIGRLNATESALNAFINDLNSREELLAVEVAAANNEIKEKEAELLNGEKLLNQNKTKLIAAKKELENNRMFLETNEADAYKKMEQAQKEIAIKELQIQLGERELTEKEQEYFEERTEAELKLDNAKKELEKIEKAKWYILDRNSIGSYVNVKSDSDSIEALGTVFPILFLAVAILMSLITVSRQIEEERGLIGTYKALGFTNGEISQKYYIYAFSASLLGGLLGDFCGFYILPQIIFNIFKSMYALTDYLIKFDFVYGVAGILLFLVCITGAAIYACRDALKNVPAVLMRPKVPQSGSRVMLENISFIWKRLSFLNKVTARNIFRYKKRLIMTLLGVMGCTALIICGFAIKDSLDELLPYQYDWLNTFDYLATAEAENNDTLVEGLETNPDVAEFINIQMETVKVKNANGDTDSMQIMAMPENESYEHYIYLESKENDEPLYLMGGGVYLTENAARILGVKRGDKIIVQDLALKETEIEINGVVKNYLSNKIYMGKKAYTKFFGEYKPNTIMVKYKDGANEKAFEKMMAAREGVVYTLSIAEVREDFSRTFAIVNVAVLIIISLAIGLAFVVLFTLSATNISERSRELATIKVLGFFNNEVHLYVNKETFLLTAMGIILGLPLGYYLGRLLTYSLKMPAVTFVQVIHPITYVYAVLISVAIALFVSLLTNASLNKINPVEALKSVE